MTPVERRGYRHVYHQYTLRIAGDRDGFQRRVQEVGIGTAVHYEVPVHRQALYVGLGYGEVSMPEAERAATQVLSIPVHPALSDEDLERVASAVRGAATGR